MIKKIIKTVILLFRQPYFMFKKTSFSMLSNMTSPITVTNSKIGKYCYVGPSTSIRDSIIKDYCSIGPNAIIGLMEHPYTYAGMSTHLNHVNTPVKLKTILEEDVWVGAGAKIKQGVTIGRGSVIGASALVLSDVEPYSIVVGIPAKKIKMRFNNQRINRLEATEFWKYSPKVARKIIGELDDFY